MSHQNPHTVLEQRVAVVVGAETPFGYAAATALAANGAHVVACTAHSRDLAELVYEVRAHGGKISIAPFDRRDLYAANRLASTIIERTERIDILLSCLSAFGMPAPLSRVSTDEWQRLIEINLTANHQLIHAFDPLLRESDAGKALFITASVTKRVRPFYGAFAVTKAALEMLVHTYAAECIASNLRVNLIDPCLMRGLLRGENIIDEHTLTTRELTEVANAMIPLCYPENTQHGQIVNLRDLCSPKGLSVFGDPIVSSGAWPSVA